MEDLKYIGWVKIFPVLHDVSNIYSCPSILSNEGKLLINNLQQSNLEWDGYSSETKKGISLEKNIDNSLDI